MATFDDDLRAAFAAQIIAAIDGGAGPGYVEFRKLSQPAKPSVAPPANSLLGTLTLSSPCAVYDGGLYRVVFSAIAQDDAADDSGTATWARFYDGDGVAVLDCTMGSLASSADIKLNATNVVAGGPLRLNSFYINV